MCSFFQERLSALKANWKAALKRNKKLLLKCPNYDVSPPPPSSTTCRIFISCPPPSSRLPRFLFLSLPSLSLSPSPSPLLLILYTHTLVALWVQVWQCWRDDLSLCALCWQASRVQVCPLLTVLRESDRPQLPHGQFPFQ